MHSLARARLPAFDSKTEFVTRDFRLADWNDSLGEFDAAVTLQAAHELRHKRRLPDFLDQIRTVLKPGAILLYCDHYAEGGQNPDLMLNRDEQPEALARAGFTEVRRVLDKGGMALYAAQK